MQAIKTYSKGAPFYNALTRRVRFAGRISGIILELRAKRISKIQSHLQADTAEIRERQLFIVESRDHRLSNRNK
jgi:hypothetical protein